MFKYKSWLIIGCWWLSSCASHGPDKLPPSGAPAEPPPPPPVVAAVLPPPPPPLPPPISPDIFDVLAYARKISTLPSASLEQECRLSERAYKESKSDKTRLQYALLLSLPGGCNDNAHALKLLQEPAAADAKGLNDLASWLKRWISETRELNERMLALEERHRAMLTKNEELQHKLDRLLEIERRLLERK